MDRRATLFFSICLLLLLSISLVATATSNDSTRHTSVLRVSSSITIDGRLEEDAWALAALTAEFRNQFPSDQGSAKNQTEVRAIFNDRFLYISAVCYFSLGYKPAIQSLKRDNLWWFSDAFSVMIDPSNARNNGMMFSVNALGAQGDCTIGNQGTQSTYNINWDAQWYSATTKYDDHWVLEMAIPFQALRYKSNNQQWAIQFIRYDMEYNSVSTWNHVPINLANFSLLRAGILNWIDIPPKSGLRAQVAPFVTLGTNKSKGEEQAFALRPGIDAKIPLSSAMNLDVTINSDYSQADVDQQVINLTRFNFFFPERRSFFLENSDIFANMGIAPVRPFFSRRIGLKDGVPVPLAGGVRLSGNINQRLRIGLMNLTEQPADSAYKNFTVGAFQKTLFKNSLFQGIVTNVQTIGDRQAGQFKYNRTAGMEFKYLTSDRRWNLIGRYHTAFREDIRSNNQYIHLGVEYNVKKWFVESNYLRLGQNYVNELGFTPKLFNYDPASNTQVRVGYEELFSQIYYRIFCQPDRAVSYHGPKLTSDVFYRGGQSINESDLFLAYEINFKNQSYLNIGIRHNFLELLYPLYLMESTFDPLPTGRYRYLTAELLWQSRPANILSFTASVLNGKFYDGQRLTINPEVKLRLQPHLNLKLYYNYNRVYLGGIYGNNTYHLIGSSVEVLFSTKIFWTTFMQLNSQSDNINVNSRLQWRFRPLSDLFLVYSDNYTTSLNGKNRAIVLKLVYWFNAVRPNG